MDKVERALRLYAIRYGCLPCPANGGLLSTDANAGAAQDGAGVYYTTSCTTDAACRADVDGSSVVPWAKLDLTEADAIDGWGNRINYYLSTAQGVHRAHATTQPCPVIALNVPYSGVSMCRGTATPFYPNAALVVQDSAGNTLTNPGANDGALFVLISHGRDGLGARVAGTGATLAAPEVGSAQATNSAGSAGPFVQDVPTDEGATYFDDIVRWRSAPAFIQSCGAGACGN